MRYKARPKSLGSYYQELTEELKLVLRTAQGID